MPAQIQVKVARPVSAREIATTILGIRRLCINCYLIAQERFEDALEYSNTGNYRFEEEFPIVVGSSYSLDRDLPVGTELILTLPENTDDKVMQAMQIVFEPTQQGK